MKIRKINKIMIGDVPYDIRWNKKGNGGSFSYPWKGKRAYIEIGIEDEKINPVRTLTVIMHELKEIIQVEQSTRFDRSDQLKTYMFIYDHAQHTDLCCRLAGLLSQFIK